MEKIKFGLIGLGNQGTFYAGLFNKGAIENGVLAAVCDIIPQKVDAFMQDEQNKDVATFIDYKEMLDSKICDVVVVVTPHYFHPEIVTECLNRNINVICDKPAGVYTKQVRQMNEAAAKSKAKFAMMFNQRTDCRYRKMREIIKEGGIGDLQRVTWLMTEWFRTQTYYDSGSWRATWVGEGGGVLFNQCPHQLDLLQWILGELPTSVRGFCKYGRWHDIEVEDEVTAYLEFANGATGVFITSTGEAPGTNRLEISGTRGKLLSEGPNLYYWKNEEDSYQFSNTSEKSFARPKCEKIEVETDGQSLGHVGILNNFANALLGLEDFFVEGTEGINGVELMNAIELSGWNGGEQISIPVDEDRYYAELQEKNKTSKLKDVDDTRVDNTASSFGVPKAKGGTGLK
ncbi:MAG: Gfo/Idh/MocA family oxidoreductase [Clostridia bacterium]|nr:Gfo/Idh/MocA family oxidoreductase [Clostridia bacterium]